MRVGKFLLLMLLATGCGDAGTVTAAIGQSCTPDKPCPTGLSCDITDMFKKPPAGGTFLDHGVCRAPCTFDNPACASEEESCQPRASAEGVTWWACVKNP